MKRILIIISLCGAVMCLNAQSKKTIYLNNGEKIDFARVKGKKTNVIYKTTGGDKQTLNYDEIHFVIHKKVVFVPDESYNMKYLKPGPLTIDIKDVSHDGSCTKGMVDAIGNTNFTGARIGGAATGFFFPIGFIGTAIIASTPPKDSKLNPPDRAATEDKEYVECYHKTVKKQKRSETWLGSALGVSLALLVGSTLMAASF